MEHTPSASPGEESAAPDYVLHLYITGAAMHSAKAVRNLTDLCERHLKGRYELLIVDIYQQPHLAKSEQIIAAPTLIRRHPLPERRLIGDLSDFNKVLTALGVEAVG